MNLEIAHSVLMNLRLHNNIHVFIHKLCYFYHHDSGRTCKTYI